MRRRVLGAILAMLLAGSIGTVRADTPLHVVLYNDLDVNGDLTAPWSEADEKADHLASPNGQSTYLVRTIKAHVRHFLASTNQHGRDVAVTAIASGGRLSTPCEQRRGEAALIGQHVQPDAVVVMASNADCFIEWMADRYGVPSFGLIEDAPQDLYLDRPGMVWSFEADMDERAADTAAFICRSLAVDENGNAGAPARYALDEDLRSSPRRFGLLHPFQTQGSTSRGPQLEMYAERVTALTTQRCGLHWGTDGPNLIRAFPEPDGGTREGLTIMNDFKRHGVTTVLCYCVPVQNELTTTKVIAAARALNYHPEYVWDHASRMDKPIWQRYYGPRAPEASFGVTKYWLMPALEQQEHYQAYQSQEPGTEPNERFSFEIYWNLWTFFTALERSGGDLSPAALKSGLTGYEMRPDDPARASGGFTGDNPFTFLDGAMTFWFDPLGSEPGIDRPLGCNRSTGERVSPPSWPLGDRDLYATEASCWAGPHRAGLLP